MRWEQWRPIYLDIADRLNLDRSADSEATMSLHEILHEQDPSPILMDLQRRIEDKTIVVCGAGPSLEIHLQSLMESVKLSDAVYIAADGAVSALLAQNFKCSVIATDLDGNLDDIKEASECGALPVVHAHGDNIERIKQFVPELEFALGSTQVEPTDRVFLWGGFTDGDRACHIATEYSPKRIILAGMDFGSIVGKWSKPMHSAHFEASDRKRIKLEIAQNLIYSLINRVDIPFTILGEDCGRGLE